MPIAELFLGAFLQGLLERLASRELLNFARREGIDKLLKKWEGMLISINLVLDDAEDGQLAGNVGVKLWLENLRNLAYDIEDLLDEFTIKSAKDESKAKPRASKACLLLPSCGFILNPCAFMFDCKMRSKIEEMDGRLKNLITQKDILKLREANGNQSADHRQDKPLPTTSLPESYFVSREDEKREILELLTGEEDDRTCADLKVIPIVGMGGVGKTALVQQVFEDAKKTGYFDVQAWICVSDDFDVFAITKSILLTINGDLRCKDKDLNWLQNTLKENISKKKFLVVLDDVWNEQYEKWTTLLKPFKLGEKGSKIILTTRNESVASLTRANAPSYHLKLLSQDACMTLFAFHALGVENFDHHCHLKVLGQKIAEKCKGLPLAAKTLGGLLHNKVSLQDWEGILNSKIWDLPEERDKILPALKISYLHLPSHLRRCFAYCAIFPKGHEIEQDELIRWWIAEGLLEQKKEKDSWNAGLNYFNELVSSSLLQKSNINKSRFLMHDLVNDLAKLVAGATYFSSEEFELGGNQNNASFARHASFIPGHYIVPERLKIYHRMKGLRSFISFSMQSRFYDGSSLSQKVLCDLLSTLKYVRVLSLSQYHIKEVPYCIGKLRHLRHLNLSHTNIETLPKSIVALHNLEALILRECHSLTVLPEGMEKLINLIFLDIANPPSLRVMPLYIGNLVGLEMLSKFVVGTNNGSRLKELEHLKNLRGKLCIFDLHKVREAGDAKDAKLCMKEGICRLAMQWKNDFVNSRDEELEAKVLDFLCPHKNLENLKISYYGGLEFPSWLGSPSYDKIVHLRLHKCCRAKALPLLGQLSLLKELYIEGLKAICRVGSEFYGIESPFPSLMTLEFKNMSLWEDWSHCVGSEEIRVLFPCLEHLVIQDCPMLIGRLPSQLNSLRMLEINSCLRMDASSFIISLPSLNELKFRGCNEGVLKSLVNLTSLINLVIEDVAELTCLNHGFTSSLIKLEKLKMKSCKNLMYLWQDKDVIRNLASLKSLVVKSCPEFISFIAGEGDLELPNNLETIKLEYCYNLEKLPSKMHTLSSLRDLIVNGCPKLVDFLKTGASTSVTSLKIHNRQNLLSLPRGLIVDVTSCLQELIISKCDSLPASLFSEGRFLPATLKKLEIMSCTGVESLVEKLIDGLESLQEIRISNCENLRSLPQGLHTLSHLTSLWLENCPALELECFPTLPLGISLQEIRISNCENLRSLPQGLHTLSHLTSLWLENCPALELECFPTLPLGISLINLVNCPKIKSLPNHLYRLMNLQNLKIEECKSITCFPDGGLPPQLQRLEVTKCKNMKQPVREWLTPLTSLQFLFIDGSVGGVGEEEDLVLPLPSSLRHLYIFSMKKVERLSSSLPPSLRFLLISSCPKLRELPQDGLPPSLERLITFRCGKLEERCKKGTGCYWPLIRQIPEVILDIYESCESIT